VLANERHRTESSRHDAVDHEPEIHAPAGQIHEILDRELGEELIGKNLRVPHADAKGHERSNVAKKRLLELLTEGLPESSDVRVRDPPDDLFPEGGLRQQSRKIDKGRTGELAEGQKPVAEDVLEPWSPRF
jgi:hypothetical protein